MRRSQKATHMFAQWVNNVLLPNPTANRLENADGSAGEEVEDDPIPLLVYPQAWGPAVSRRRVAAGAWQAVLGGLLGVLAQLCLWLP